MILNLVIETSVDRTIFLIIFLTIFFSLLIIGISFVKKYNRKFENPKSSEEDKSVHIHLKGKTTVLIHHFLMRIFPYYAGLNEPNQQKFLKRLIYFINTTEFIPRNKIVLNFEQIVLISAVFIQITFGLNKYLLFYFNRIYLYPKEYLNNKTGHHHKGEVDLRGTISISWEHFKEGIAISDDGINLGLHEMGHALFFEIIKYREKNAKLFQELQPIYLRAEKEIAYQLNRTSIFRDYAFVNPKEYFAVAIENFFEIPEKLKLSNPELYDELTILLRQNPI